MDAFSEVLRTLESLRKNEAGLIRSLSKIERLPAISETRWSIENLPITDLSMIHLSEHVTSLYFVECRKLTTLSGISDHFPKLKNLWIYSCERLTNLDGLQALKELETLTIWPSVSGNMTIQSFGPIAGATMLRSLMFAGRISDGSLTPLYGLRHLRKVFMSNNFVWDEFARFEAHQPDIDFPWKGGVLYDANPKLLTCPSCKRAQAMLTGKGLRLCCPDCDAERLAKHVKRYAELSQNS